MSEKYLIAKFLFKKKIKDIYKKRTKIKKKVLVIEKIL